MRKILTVLTLALLASCGGHLPWRSASVPAIEARDSVYKVKVVLTIDTSSLYEDEKKDEAGEGEKSKKIELLPSTSDLNQSATVVQLDQHTAQVGWSGTGWVAAHQGGRSFLMTAGHVCESRDSFTVRFIDWSKFEIVEKTLPIIKKEHMLLSREDVEIGPATVLADEDLDEQTYAGKDLCLMGVHGDLGTALPIASDDPEYGSHAEVIGAPTGLWGGGVAIIADLKFAGRGNVWGGEVAEGLAFTGDVAGGNSGSAIMKDGQVVALLNLGGTRFKELTTGVPWEVLRDFLRKNLHRKP